MIFPLAALLFVNVPNWNSACEVVFSRVCSFKLGIKWMFVRVLSRNVIFVSLVTRIDRVLLYFDSDYTLSHHPLPAYLNR